MNTHTRTVSCLRINPAWFSIRLDVRNDVIISSKIQNPLIIYYTYCKSLYSEKSSIFKVFIPFTMPSNCGMYVEDKIFQNPLKKEEILIGINHWDWDLDGDMKPPEYDPQLGQFGFSREVFEDVVKLVRNEVVEKGGSGGGFLWKWCDCFSDKYCNYCYCYCTFGVAYCCHLYVQQERKQRNDQLKRRFNEYVAPMHGQNVQWQLTLITDPKFYEYGKDQPWTYPEHPYAPVEKVYGALIVVKFPSPVQWNPEPSATAVTQDPYNQQPPQDAPPMYTAIPAVVDKKH